MELELGEQRFDYVIAHGLLSWVPDPVRDRVLALSRAALGEHGRRVPQLQHDAGVGDRAAVRHAGIVL